MKNVLTFNLLFAWAMSLCIATPTFHYAILGDEKPLTSATSGIKPQSISALFQQIQKTSEYFTINLLGKDSVRVKAKEGTIISFPPRCFVYEDGSPVLTKVNVEVKECYKLSDLLATNINSTAGELLLKTGGACYIQASAEGKNLKLAAKKVLRMEVPNTFGIEKPELFYGENRWNGLLDWHPFEDFAKKKVLETEEYWDTLTVAYNVFGNDTKKSVYARIQKGNGILETKYLEQLFLNNNWEENKGNVGTQIVRVKGKGILNGYVLDMYLADIVHINAQRKMAKPMTVKDTAKLRFTQKVRYFIYNANWEKVSALDLAKIYLKETSPIYQMAKKETFLRDSIKKAYYDKKNLANLLTPGIKGMNSSRLVLSTNTLGWLNINDFLTEASLKTTLYVQTGKAENTSVKLVIKENEYETIIPASSYGSYFGFSDIPAGKNAILVATQVINGTVYFGSKAILTGENTIEDIQFIPMEFEELQLALQNLND